MGETPKQLTQKLTIISQKTEVHTHINLESESKQIPNHTHDFRA
jgi:hypothetical protein